MGLEIKSDLLMNKFFIAALGMVLITSLSVAAVKLSANGIEMSGEKLTNVSIVEMDSSGEIKAGEKTVIEVNNSGDVSVPNGRLTVNGTEPESNEFFRYTSELVSSGGRACSACPNGEYVVNFGCADDISTGKNSGGFSSGDKSSCNNVYKPSVHEVCADVDGGDSDTDQGVIVVCTE